MPLTVLDRRLLRLFTACVLGRWDDVRTIRAEAQPPEPDRSWRETVLQVHVFAGFPRLVEAYGVLADAGGLGERERGENLAENCARARDESARERGRKLFERIYAADAPAVRAMLENYDPEFAAWIEEHAYGRVLARPGLPADRRELLAVAALAALGQERQLASHARGSLRLGATQDELSAVLHAIADLITPERAEKARRVIERFAWRGEPPRA